MGVMTERTDTLGETVAVCDSPSTKPLRVATDKFATDCEAENSASNPPEQKGADLLLSLAETASEHADQQKTSVKCHKGLESPLDIEGTSKLLMSADLATNEVHEGDHMTPLSLHVKPTVTPGDASPSEFDELYQLTSTVNRTEHYSPHQSPIRALSSEAISSSSAPRAMSSDTATPLSSLETTLVSSIEQNTPQTSSVHVDLPCEASDRTKDDSAKPSSPGMHRKRFAYRSFDEELDEINGEASSPKPEPIKSSSDLPLKEIDSESNLKSPEVEDKVIISPSSSNERSEDGDDHHSEGSAGRRKKRKQDATNEIDETATRMNVMTGSINDQADSIVRQSHLRHTTYPHSAAPFFHHSTNAPRPPHPPHFMFVAPPFVAGSAMPPFGYPRHAAGSPFVHQPYFANPSMYGARMAQPGSLSGMYPSPQHYPPLPMYNVMHSKVSNSPNTKMPPRSSAEKTDVRTKKNVGKNMASQGLAMPGKFRCVLMNNPVSASAIRNGHQQNVQIPDFMLLVNYPDYLARGRSGRGDLAPGLDGCVEGKKHCVMCGKLRVCSASSSTISSKKSSFRESSQDEESESTHIIPRQNKGVCTACDVAVWVVVDSEDQLEIKWCKGCKNFRPWISFGEKGMATKCVRCRNRQKEKYANQKKENIMNSGRAEWDLKNDATELERDAAALKGLQQLRRAAAM